MKKNILILMLVLSANYLLAQATVYYGTQSGTVGTYNSNFGYNAGHGNTTGNYNSAIGNQSLLSNTTGSYNTALGYQALYWNTTSSNNTAIGATAGSATTGNNNTFVGNASGYSNTSGSANTLIGSGAGYSSTTGTQNSFLGDMASYHNTTGNANTVFGYSALYQNSTGANNTALGDGAGYNALGGSNVFLGFNAGLNETGSNKLYIANSGTNPPLIYGDFSAGNIGLGTITPQVLLDVQGGTGTSTIRVTSHSAPNTASVEASASGNLAFMEGTITPSSAVRFGSRTNLDMYLATNNTNRMVVKTSGYVGINTTTPGYQLDVNGVVNATGVYVNGVPVGSGGSSLWSTSGSSIYFNSGTLGLGTSTPNSNYKLDAAGIVNATGFYLNGVPTLSSQWTTTGTNIYYNTGTVGLGTATPNSAYKLDAAGIINATGFYLNGAPFVNSQWTTTSGTNINYATGNVGIGSSSPDYKLTVNGTIHSTEVKVTATVPGPDYVFEKDYKLLSLEEIKAYIEQNKHLPEVPSAKEMETNGLSLGEMNLLLLKKVEELTLHLIDLKNENNRLNERVEKLEDQK